MSKEVGQEYSRVDTILYDVHGRPWHAILERKTMTPTGPISPMFRAPFYPDQKYLRPGGQRNPIHLGINYDQMDIDLQEAHQEREQTIRRLIVKSFPASQHQKLIKNPPEEILWAVDGNGEGPMPVEVVWACMQGNRWVLGYSDKEPEWVQEMPAVRNFFHPPLKEFARRRAELIFGDAENDEAQARIELTDAEIAPINPHNPRNAPGSLEGLDGEEIGPEVGVGGEHGSWGAPEPSTSVRSPLRKE